MITKDLKKLLEKLNDHTTRALESAAGFCIGRGHYEVSIEHLFLKLLEDGSGDLPHIFARFNSDPGPFWDAMIKRLETFRAGNSGRPTISPVLLQLVESAWITGSIHHDYPEIRSGNLMEAFLEHESLRAPYANELSAIRGDELRQDFMSIVAGSAEDAPAKLSVARHEAVKTKREGENALDLYTTDLTGNARDGKIDPVFGRDKEIRQMIDILSRRRKNNPILVGEAGVGKTAVVEGLALRIVQGDVPSNITDVEIRGLDLGLLQAGAGVKGEFENRLKSVIQQVKEAPKPIILFIDEAHTLIGAGGAAGTSDAANLLKPALARGELRTIAATTWSEYKRYFEKDAALERRFQMVKVDEPSAEVAITMLRGIKSKYEAHHGITVSDEAVSTTVKLAERFISGRQLPDKAVDLLDTSAARVHMGQTAKPAALDDAERQVKYLDVKIAALQRDVDTGVLRDGVHLAAMRDEREKAHQARMNLEQRWNKERELVEKIGALRKELATLTSTPADGRAPAPPDGKSDTLRQSIDTLKATLHAMQGEDPLVYADVDGTIAAQVVADWTGIPVGSMMKDEAQVLLNLETRLCERILGQDEAIRQVADTIRTAKAGMRNPEAPIAVFLFAGPSGTGKTECARTVADVLFGGERFVITINMSEYQEAHTVSQLKGSPPGYVGYGEGGILTEAVRQRPYSVVLLDEVEKAHRDVMNLFYQVFDKGFMRDGEGREIDFKNTIIMMTSNLGSDVFMQVCTEDEHPTPDQLREAIHPQLVNHFQAALLARMKVVPFYPLRKETMKGIVRMKLSQIGKRLRDAHNMSFVFESAVVDRIADRCTEVDTGARNVDFVIDRTVLPDVSKALLAKMAEQQVPATLTLGINEAGEFTYAFA
jgi:type VI secretion system protein VasG